MQNWLHDRLIDFANKIMEKSNNSSNIPYFDDFITFYGGYHDPLDLQLDDWANEVIKRLHWPLFFPKTDLIISNKAFLFNGVFPELLK